MNEMWMEQLQNYMIVYNEVSCLTYSDSIVWALVSSTGSWEKDKIIYKSDPYNFFCEEGGPWLDFSIHI